MYYVAPDGDDSNPGTIDRPWRTLAAVHARDFSPGDVISFRRGGSWSGGLVINDSGVDGNPITFTAYGSGKKPVFTNPGAGGRYTRAIEIDGDWVVVDSFLVQDAHEAGVYVSTGADHNVIRDIEATNTGFGISVHGRFNLVTGNYLHDLHMILNTPGGNDDYGAVGIDLNNASDNEISHNRMENCKAASHDYGSDGGAVEVFGNADRNYIHHNWATAANGFVEVGGGLARDNIVAYNVSVNNGHFSTMHLSGKFASSVKSFRIENNTIVETAAGDQGYEVLGFVGELGQSTVLVRNNIFWIERGSGESGGLHTLSSASGFTHENNVYNLVGELNLGFDLGPGETTDDPLFADLHGDDFHLQSGSPAIDTGADLEYSRDYDNRAVPFGTAPDIGAFEYRP